MKFNLLKHTGTYTYLIILSIFVLFPLVFSFSQSLMTNQEVNRWPPPIIPGPIWPATPDPSHHTSPPMMSASINPVTYRLVIIPLLRWL